ncbi:MAG: hypothetical protein GX410_10900 [Elusimicrobia bacterium]|nr:hypothetical protein [Elusimicrobiota bacterium]
MFKKYMSRLLFRLSVLSFAAFWLAASACCANYTVSGIVTKDGSRFQGVTITVSGGASATAVSDALGDYSFSLASGLSYTLTPSKSGYVFTPVSYSTDTLSGNWSGSDFTASAVSYLVSGTITSGGAPLSGIRVKVLGGPMPQPAPAVTDSNGRYSLSMLPGTYDIGPDSSYMMSPARRTVTVVSGDLSGNDFIATADGGRAVFVTGGPDGYARPRQGYNAVIKFTSPSQSGDVDVNIYTLRGGRLVRSLRVYVRARNPSELEWDCLNSSGEMAGSGIYVATVKGAGYDEKIKIGVLK